MCYDGAVSGHLSLLVCDQMTRGLLPQQDRTLLLRKRMLERHVSDEEQHPVIYGSTGSCVDLILLIWFLVHSNSSSL